MSRKQLDPIPPGEILREEFMRPLGISVTALARDIAVPANRISQIVNGKRALSADTALRLGKYFGVSPEIWLDLQSDYELRLARRTTWKRVEPRVRTRCRGPAGSPAGRTSRRCCMLAASRDPLRVRDAVSRGQSCGEIRAAQSPPSARRTVRRPVRSTAVSVRR